MNCQTEQSEIQSEHLPDISIIIPVYNAETGLPRCMESILKQNYENFEVLLIDDGSTDRSAEICDSYAAQDTRIRVLHKENSGVSDSRNQGLRLARGKYIQFMDSDDWITPEACDLMISAAEKNRCDLVICDFYRVVDDRFSRKGSIKKEGILSRDEFSSYLMEKPSDFYYGVLWNKLYRRDLIEAFQIRLAEDISWCEDIIFNLEYFLHMNNVYVLRVPVYYYVKNSSSLSNSGISLSRVIQTKMLVSEYYKHFCEQTWHPDKHDKASMYWFYLSAATDGMIHPYAPKLGKEQIELNSEVVQNNGLFADRYLEKKCMEYCMKTAEYQSDLTMEELTILLCIYQNPGVRGKKELRELTGISKRRISSTLKKFQQLRYIAWEETEETKENKMIRILPAAYTVIQELQVCEQRQNDIRFADFTEEERTMYEALSLRIRNNMLSRLHEISLPTDTPV